MKTATYTKPLTIVFTAKTFAGIQAVTDREHISMGEWVRKAVETALENENDTTLEGEK